MDVMSAGDRDRKAAMQRMKRLALGLLVVLLTANDVAVFAAAV